MFGLQVGIAGILLKNELGQKNLIIGIGLFSEQRPAQRAQCLPLNLAQSVEGQGEIERGVRFHAPLRWRHRVVVQKLLHERSRIVRITDAQVKEVCMWKGRVTTQNVALDIGKVEHRRIHGHRYAVTILQAAAAYHFAGFATSA